MAESRRAASAGVFATRISAGLDEIRMKPNSVSAQVAQRPLYPSRRLEADEWKAWFGHANARRTFTSRRIGLEEAFFINEALDARNRDRRRAGRHPERRKFSTPSSLRPFTAG